MKCENGIFELDKSDKTKELWESSADTRKLYEKVGNFEDIFFDMIFQQGSLTEKMIRCQINGIDNVIDLPNELNYFMYCMFRFAVEPLEGCNGKYDIWEQKMFISPECLEEDSVILHEMIHLHESVLMTLPIYYHEAVMYCLLTDLSSKISNLNDILEICTHIFSCEQISEEGGLHDMLFLLKSLDIDLRFGWELGTTYGYDMIDSIKNI
ncbi:hypothetical protein [Ruminococcus flavefaciens]|uniref:hypothetical protein n=1 Tax=Ruminococcus flavefaciens TaxID=1265 RepID=UPI00046362F2|nr:hypothetical protein [Ruminococcus flavefaciens]